MRFSAVCRPFQLPTDAEIANVALAYFQDPYMTMTTRRFGSEKIFQFELSNPVDKTGHALPFTIAGKSYKVPLYSYEKKQKSGSVDRENTLLLTFKFAAKKWMSHIQNCEFDKVIQHLKLRLEIPTQLQKVYQSDAFNGNRYCVIEKPSNLNVIPDSITVTDKMTRKTYRVTITYKNKEKMCARCMQKHVGACPELEKFYKAKDEKEQMRQNGEVKTKIYTDSYMRQTEATGLKAEVACMSGGGFGQVVQAVADDPEAESKSNIIILSGANDFKNESFESEEEYCENIEKSMDKLLHHAQQQKEKNFAIIRAHPSTESIENEEDLTKIARREYFFERINQKIVETAPDNITTVDVSCDLDATNHPTVESTCKIIRQIEKETNIAFIWNVDYLVTQNKYAGVESLFRYGCNTCDGFGATISMSIFNNPTTCDRCINSMRSERQTTPHNYPHYDQVKQEVNKWWDAKKTEKKRSRDDQNEKDAEPTTKKMLMHYAAVANCTKDGDGNGENMDIPHE